MDAVTRRPILCCHKCEQRRIGCHDTCEIYISEKKKWEEVKNKKRMFKMYHEDVYDRLTKKEKKK